jgi:putative hydrolase of the HAD superfamily
VTVSDQIGHAKPDPAIHQLTVDRLGVPANECVFADDVPHNLEPAAALGIMTVLVDEPADAVLEIATLLDLPET